MRFTTTQNTVEQVFIKTPTGIIIEVTGDEIAEIDTCSGSISERVERLSIALGLFVSIKQVIHCTSNMEKEG